MKICVLLPTLNEAECIKNVIERVKKIGPDYSIYVVDSGSTDGTVEIAKKAGAKLIILREKGKGFAIRKAFQEIDEDLAVLLDSDASYAPEEIPNLLRKLENCDMVVGSRFKGRIEKGSMSTVNRVGNHALTAIANTLYGKQITDVCSGFWALKKKAYKSMDVDAKHFELEVNFYVECAKKGMKLCEVPISYCTRRGRSKLTMLHGLEIGLYLLLRRI